MKNNNPWFNLVLDLAAAAVMGYLIYRIFYAQ
jgi:hypothetical protein